MRFCDSRALAPRSFENTTVASDSESQIASLTPVSTIGFLTIVRFSSALSNQKFPFADPAALNLMTTPPLPEQIEAHRDRMWRRDEDLRVESAIDAERFIEKKPKPGSGLRFVRFF